MAGLIGRGAVDMATTLLNTSLRYQPILVQQ
jgi:hypothetical protein